MIRELLPSRRSGEIIATQHTWMPGTERAISEPMLVTVGRYPDGRIGEVFINYENRLNERAINLGHDIATILSIALQYGAPLDVLAGAVGRSEVNLMGKPRLLPHTPVGTVLDLLMLEASAKALDTVPAPAPATDDEDAPPEPAGGDLTPSSATDIPASGNIPAELVPPAAALGDDEPVTPDVEPSAPKTLKGRVATYAAAHPNSTVREIADALGANRGSVNTAAWVLGLKLRSVTPAERQELALAGMQEAKVKRADVRPTAEIKAPTGPVLRPKGVRFYLRDRKTGMYLHESLTVSSNGLPLMTDKRHYAWCNTEVRMVAVRRLHPSTMDLREEVAL